MSFGRTALRTAARVLVPDLGLVGSWLMRRKVQSPRLCVAIAAAEMMSDTLLLPLDLYGVRQDMTRRLSHIVQQQCLFPMLSQVGCVRSRICTLLVK